MKVICPVCDGTGMQYDEPERKESIIIKRVPCSEPIGWPYPCPKKLHKPYHPNIPTPFRMGDLYSPYDLYRNGYTVKHHIPMLHPNTR